MSGTVKLKPLVIGKFANPRCFKNFRVNEFVNYTHSTKSWMNHNIFNKWLLDWDINLEKAQKKVLLILDNCPSHKITVVLTRIEIIFIPPNLTSKFQPLDQGIIKCFKTFFKNRKLNDIIKN